MKTKIACLIIFWLLSLSQPISAVTEIFSKKDIKDLYEAKKYSILLEKSISLLNGSSGKLTPSEDSFLKYYTGAAYLKQGNNSTATGYFRELEQKHPDSPFLKDVYIKMAELDKDDYFKWESWLLKLFNKFPKSPESVKASITLSKSYLKLKNYTKAVRLLETVINLWKMEDTDRESIILLALAYSGIRDYIEAVDYVKKADQLIPETIQRNPQYLFEAGNIYYNTQNFEEAIESHHKFLNIYTKSPKIAKAAIQMADAYQRTGNRYMAAIYLITVVRQKRGEEKDYTLLLNLARTLMNLNEKDYKKIARRYPIESKITPILQQVRDNSRDFNEKREAVLLLGTSLKKDDRKKELFNIYFEFLKNKRDKYLESIFKKTLENYISELLAKKDYNSIADVWSKLKTRKSLLSAENLLAVAKMFYNLGLYGSTEDIIRHIKKYTMYRDFHHKADILMVQTLFKRDEYPQLLKYLDKMKKVPQNLKTQFLYYKFIALEEVQKETQLAKELVKVKDTKPSDIYSYRILLMKSRKLELKGKYPEALKSLNSALQFKKASRVIPIIEKADLLYRLDRFDEALDFYQRVQNPSPKNGDWILFQKINIMKHKENRSEITRLKKELKEKYPESYWLKQLNIDDQ